MITPRLLVDFAAACRTGLESLAKRTDSMFSGFPAAACGPASELVGRLLHEELGLESVYVCGVGHPQLRPGQSHAWVEVGDYLIDITHDQFPGTGLIGWVRPRACSWHASFRDVDRREGFCMPEGWPMYPFDGYAAMKSALRPAD
jgi:hypothetical protein